MIAASDLLLALRNLALIGGWGYALWRLIKWDKNVTNTKTPDPVPCPRPVYCEHGRLVAWWVWNKDSNDWKLSQRMAGLCSDCHRTR